MPCAANYELNFYITIGSNVDDRNERKRKSNFHNKKKFFFFFLFLCLFHHKAHFPSIGFGMSHYCCLYIYLDICKFVLLCCYHNWHCQ
jgi:hypothetical protein